MLSAFSSCSTIFASLIVSFVLAAAVATTTTNSPFNASLGFDLRVQAGRACRA